MLDQVVTQTQLHALKTFALSASAPRCTTSILLGVLHSYWPPHAAHNQLQGFFFLLLPSPCPEDAPYAVAMRANMRQCDSPIPSTGAMILLKKYVLFLVFLVHCSGGRCPPRQPCRRPPEVSQTSNPDFLALYARRIIWALQYVYPHSFCLAPELL